MSLKIDDWPMTRGAEFSLDKQYRWKLWRQFKTPAPTGPFARRQAIFIMLNPSTADENVADPTVRRCIRYAFDWGCLGLTVLNLFALRATDPRELYRHRDPVGVQNDTAIVQAIGEEIDCDYDPVVVCAWGSHGVFLDRGPRVAQKLRQLSFRFPDGVKTIQPTYLRMNVDGQPAHPLYLPANLTPTPWMV